MDGWYRVAPGRTAGALLTLLIAVRCAAQNVPSGPLQQQDRRIEKMQPVPGPAATGGLEAFTPTATGSLFEQQAREDQAADPLSGPAAISQFLDFQYGGWVDYYYFLFDDGIQSQRQFHRPSTSFWTRARLDDGAHEFFARVRVEANYFKPGDEYDKQEDWVGPEFDRWHYQFDLRAALKESFTADTPDVRFRIGRQDVIFGTGYALDMPLDAGILDIAYQNWRLQGLFGFTPGNYPNIDRSPPVASHSDRRFFGVQLIYEGFERHRPFAYAIWNDDATDERIRDFLQNYSYDTQYFGFGSTGELFPRLDYWAEGVIETGRSYGDGDFYSRDYVSAWALDAGLQYRFRGRMRKRVAFEYMFASGDSGRVLSSNSAAGGNRGDNKDKGFNAFGYRDTGIAAAFENSNLHIWKVGGSLTPLEQFELLRDLELGSNAFLYHKHHSRGAISDVTAGEFEGFVGWELDYFVNWRITSDLSWTIRWGVFFPGAAYSDQGTRQFLMTGFTWSF